MVRLKDEANGKLAGTYVISIPYGAIKRTLLNTTINDTFIFQFLMVRLKEDLLLYCDTINLISIPYGAIKSRRPR